MEATYTAPSEIVPVIARARSWISQIERRLLLSRSLLVTTVGVIGFLIAMFATLSRGGWPAARVHDEFSYLLAADTYAHGRLTNPTHPMWEHFETFHVLQRPTYTSKYPPAQGLFMAIGQVLTGEPIVGVWLSYALMCAAITWMLLGSAPPRWALWGGVFTALWLVGLQTTGAYWVRSYWGGAAAAFGSALLFGGIRRILEQPRARDAVITAIGLGVLANTRPFEGLLVALLPGLAFGVWLIRAKHPPLGVRLTRGLLPLAITLAAIGAWMGYYDYRTTGRVLRIPYVEYEETYSSSNPIVYSPARSTVFRHDVMRKFYSDTIINPRVLAASPAKLARQKVEKVKDLAEFFIPLYVFVPLLMVPFVFRDRWNRFAFGSVTLGGVGILITSWTFPHYAAPLLGPLVLLLIACVRRLGLLRIRKDFTGLYLVRLVLACAAFSAFASMAGKVINRGRLANEWEGRRAAIVRKLEAMPANHLVLVTYGPGHDVNREWVYNRADIDGAKIVWARSMGSERDERLLRYFANRNVWSLTVGDPDSAFALSELRKTP